VSYPNAAARTVEDAVVSPLRNTLLQVNRLSGIRSRSREESAVLYLDFPFGTDPDLAFIEVNEKIDQAMNQLPREVARPRVLATDVSDIPVVQLSVTLATPSPTPPHGGGVGEGVLDISDLARNVLRRRLEQLPEVAFADLSGQREPQIVVRPNNAALRALGLIEADLANLLRNANIELGGLLLADGHYQYNVRFTGDLRTAEDLRNLYLQVGNPRQGVPRTLPLSDLATVSYEAEPARGLFFHDGQPGIVFTLRKRADARLFDLRENLQILVADLKKDYPELRFNLNNDQTSILRASIDNLSGGLLYGAGFAILVLFAFFREWRRPLLIGIAVPIALLIAVLGFYLAGLSINVISLAGLILGLGLMIDNSIIVLDNIASYRSPGDGKSLIANPETPSPALPMGEGAGENAARFSSGDGKSLITNPLSHIPYRKKVAEATNEVIRPLISSALTTIAVFLPLVLLSGVAGALFRDQAIAVTLALAASLLVAYFLLPMLTVLLAKKTSPTPAENAARFDGKSRIKYRQSNIAYLLLLLPWLALGYFTLESLPTRGFPELSRTDFQLNVDWDEALPLTSHSTRVRALKKDWQENFGGQATAFVGENQFLLSEENQAINASELQFYLEGSPVPDFADDWLANQRASYPAATFTFQPIANLFDRIFLNDDPYLEVRLRASGDRQTPAWETVQPLLSNLRNAGYQPSPPARSEAVSLRINYPQLSISRVSPERLRARLLTLFSENEVTRLRANDRALPVLLAGTEELSTQELLSATVTNQDGNEIPLRYLITTERRPDYRVLTADGAGEYLSLTFPGEPAAANIAAIEKIVAQYPDFTGQLAGRFLTDQSRIGELGGVLGVSLLLLYLILAAQFEGLKLPLVVLLVVPVSLVGSLLALWVTGGSLNLLSLIGMVVTGGIVVNDAIIKVDMIERGRKSGLPLAAAIKEASRRRLRAIVMTSLTTILALAPVLFTSGLGAELQQPLAITVIGGLVVGTLGSLYVVPLLYRLFSGGEKETTKALRH
jgi:multidrug efflux pump subunit AcrB